MAILGKRTQRERQIDHEGAEMEQKMTNKRTNEEMAKTLTTTKLWAILAAACVLALLSSVTLAANEGRASVLWYPPTDPTATSGPSSTGGEDLTHETVRATGVLEKPGATTYQYGTHAITDEASGTLYALQSTTDGSVDLDRYVGQRVAVTGWVVPGYPLEGGPILLEVTEVRPAEVPPAPPIIDGPTDNSYDTDGSLTFFGTAEAGTTIGLFEEGDPQPVGSASADGSGAWSLTLSGVGEGTHSYTAKATSSSGLTSVASEPVRVSVDTQTPMVKSTDPASGVTGVAPGVNISATFSEKMLASSIDAQTFKLFRKRGFTNKEVAASVRYDAATETATLDPTNPLQKGISYNAVLTTWAKDLVGNRLEQRYGWSFTVGSKAQNR